MTARVGQYQLSYSLKLFEYVACELPVVMPDFGEWLAVNRKYKLGINVDVQSVVLKRY